MVEDVIELVSSYIEELEKYDLNNEDIKKTRDSIIKKFNISLLRLQKLQSQKIADLDEVCSYIVDKTTNMMNDFKENVVTKYIDDIINEMGISKDIIENDELINKLIDEAYEEINKEETIVENNNSNIAAKSLAEWLGIGGR